MKKLTAKELLNFLIWMSYNRGRYDVTTLKYYGEPTAKEYLKATKGTHKYCKCGDKGHSVNKFWKNWTCTYCLRPKRLDRNGCIAR